MTYDPRGGGGLDYMHCRYGASKLLFRGPARQPDGRHIAVLGGTETYGKFIATPWPDLLEAGAGRPVVNLAQLNAGPDVHLADPAVADICRTARATVIEVPGAHNLSNPYYMVHPRRNDRFVRASALLQALYGDVDFTDYHFTRHLLGGLRAASGERFAQVAAALRAAWVEKMRALTALSGGPVILLWLSDHHPGRAADDPLARAGPVLVDRAMMDAVRPLARAVVEIIADAEERREGYAQMRFGDLDAAAAAQMLGPAVHRRAALRVGEALAAL